MDCIIPGDAIRPFCAAISCLSRVGKDLYIDFDPLDGLTIRSLNDSKSVFGSFHFEPSFFTQCKSSPFEMQAYNRNHKVSKKTKTTTTTKKKRKGNRNNRHDDDDDDRSQSTDGSVDAGDDDHDDNNENDNEDDDRWIVKIAIKALAPIVRSRKDVIHLHLVTIKDHLAFEFHVQKYDNDGDNYASASASNNGNNINNNNNNHGSGNAGVVRIVHKVGYAPANGVMAVVPMEESSELIIQPHVLSTMIEPLKRSVEIAILVNETHRLVSSVTFSHEVAMSDHSSSTATSRLQQQQASVKTEVSVGYDDLVEVHYAGIAPGQRGTSNHHDNRNGSTTTVQPLNGPSPPYDLKEQVVLVFTLKEFKSFLQFCSQSVMGQELQLTIQFHWGGQPMLLKTEGEGFVGEVVMATLDHHLIGDLRTSSSTAGAEVAAAAAAGEEEENTTTNTGSNNDQ